MQNFTLVGPRILEISRGRKKISGRTNKRSALKLKSAPQAIAFVRTNKEQNVTENALFSQIFAPSSYINQSLRIIWYPRYLSWFQVSLKSVEKCGSFGCRTFGLLTDLAHRLYNSVIDQWFSDFFVSSKRHFFVYNVFLLLRGNTVLAIY